jgi:hypothetical protein
MIEEMLKCRFALSFGISHFATRHCVVIILEAMKADGPEQSFITMAIILSQAACYLPC